MDFAAKHIGFVLASYGAAFLLIGGLVVLTAIRYRAVRRRLRELEQLGAPRRKAATGAGLSVNEEKQPA